MTLYTIGSIMILIPLCMALLMMLGMFIYALKEGPWQVRVIALMLASFIIGTLLVGGK